MCGIAGVLGPAGVDAAALRATATRMATCLRHRGPDDEGTWIDAAAGVALGFRRLAILDLSPHGHQPMTSADGRFVIVYNGEIYNFAELRKELEGFGHVFRGHSDTEVALAAFVQWGVSGAVTRFNGMFAIALWDARDRTLHLVRDRLGKKPLYYGRAGSAFTFASELKALRAHPEFDARIDRVALALYLRYGHVPAPHSIYDEIKKLPPGGLISVTTATRTLPEPVRYWSMREAAISGIRTPETAPVAEVIARLDALLRDAVALRMVADVPLGALLSGGVDSSLVVALMQAQSARPVKTFSIGFDEPDYDEAPYARTVARHLGTEHTELYVTSDEARAIIPRLPTVYDEPFADSSQIPTFLVCQLARRDVTVALTGDGGDELFGGYGRYAMASRIWRRLAPMPVTIRRAAARALGVAAVFAPQGTAARRRSGVGERLERLAALMRAENASAFYLEIVSHWSDSIVVDAPAADADVDGDVEAFDSFTHAMMCRDAAASLPDDMLTKVDRASMAVSLEARAPLLDYRVAELAWRIPLSMKLSDGTGKWPLRRLLSDHLPRAMVERPKMGFDVPIATWLRGPLRAWAEALLDERRLREQGLLDAAAVRRAWREHLEGARNRAHRLWTVVMFELWIDALRS